MLAIPNLQVPNLRMRDTRLRFVFDDTVMSYSVAADATFGDIAAKLREVAGRRRCKPVAIDVTVGDSTMSLWQLASMCRSLHDDDCSRKVRVARQSGPERLLQS